MLHSSPSWTFSHLQLTVAIYRDHNSIALLCKRHPPLPILLALYLCILVVSEAQLSTSLHSMFNVDVICHLDISPPPSLGYASPMPPGISTLNTAYITSNITNPQNKIFSSFLWQLGTNAAPPLALPKYAPTTDPLHSQLLCNPIFNDTLFGTFKCCLVNGKGVRSGTLCDKFAKVTTTNPRAIDSWAEGGPKLSNFLINNCTLAEYTLPLLQPLHPSYLHQECT